MDIKAKLALLKKTAENVDKKHQKKKKPVEKPALVLPDFIEEETPEGTVYYRETSFPLRHRHGSLFLYEIFDSPPEILAFLATDENYGEMDLKKTLFVDTETTGLAGGSGTCAFLTGAGFLRDGNFVVRQYFMPDYMYENAMLAHFLNLVKEHTGFVSFNGKSYDLPLIKTRMAMNRLRCDFDDYFHLDLLHSGRRFWKKTLDSCSLTSLETSVLDFKREDDVPGYLIPDLFFQYIRNKDFQPLDIVFQHNLFDIVSMAVLIARMWSHLELAECGNLCGTEYFSLGRIYEIRGDEEKALSFYQKARNSQLPRHTKAKITENIASILKKRKDHSQAVQMWEEMAGESELDITPFVELAKYYEHTAKDIQKAIEYTDKAWEITSRKRNAGFMSSYYAESEALKKRKERLRKKLEKKSKQPS
ncbi:MAG: ribonuclease H-like domain-containing protein [Firmicutes bacterium]|nr:ribonuclease H-like domain-containing protein [Bacillota bacterium]